MGFAPGGSPIDRQSCDTVDSNSFPGGATDGDQRLCWHTGANTLNAGWRCGKDDFLQSNPNFERLIYTRPGPLE